MKVVIVGAGGHAMVVCDTLLTASADVMGFVDDDLSLHGREILDLPVLGSLDSLAMAGQVALVIGVGENGDRRRCFDRAHALGYAVVNAIHPLAVLSARCSVGAGVMIMGGVVVNVGADIGNNVILNTSCKVDHHCVVGAHAHIAPGATLAGAVTVGEETLVGAGAVILPGIRIGSRSIVAAGAVVTRDVPDGVTVAGVPARIAVSAADCHTPRSDHV